MNNIFKQFTQEEMVITPIEQLFIKEYDYYEYELGDWLSIANVSVYEKGKVYCKNHDEVADKLWRTEGGSRGTNIITEYRSDLKEGFSLYEVKYFHKGQTFIKWFEVEQEQKNKMWRD